MNRTYFPTDSSFRIALALRINAACKHGAARLAVTKEHKEACDACAVIARCNDISVNFIGFGSVTEADVEWLIAYLDYANLWIANQRESFIAIWDYAKTFEGDK